MTQRTQSSSVRVPGIRAATSAKLDLELAHQLGELTAADADPKGSRRQMAGAMVEAAVWALVAIGAWIVIVRLA